MSSNFILKYPLDLRGTSATNLVVNEVHSIPSNGNRVIVTNYGPFYTKGLKVVDYSTGEELERGVQWKAAQLYTEAVQRTGKEVCAVIVITDDAVSGEVALTYQVVGGKFSRAVPVIKDLIDALDIDEREVQWGDLLAVPEAFPPVSHLHDAGDLYGFEYVVAALEELNHAILIGDEAAHQEIIGYIVAREQESIARDNAITDQLYEHAGNRSNPHEVTKIQVGLGNVENYPVASQAEAEAGVASNRYMTPLRVSQAVSEQVGSAFDSHINNTQNPHEVTKAQVGLGSVQNHGLANQSQGEGGTSNSHYMTPLRVKQAIDAQIRPAHEEHVSDTSNPHSVTKAQVGLGDVENYPVASQSQAEAGTASNRYMTPQRTSQAISSQALVPLNNHAGNAQNPHNVTKAQVGLGSVQNYATATSQAQATGTATNLYMTPSATRQAIDSRVGTEFNSHANASNNPHRVTKSQVGLGNVQNYSIASAAEARAGTATNRYMTPQRTAQAIAELATNGVGSNNSIMYTISWPGTASTCTIEFWRQDVGNMRIVTMRLYGWVGDGAGNISSVFSASADAKNYIPTGFRITGNLIPMPTSPHTNKSLWINRDGNAYNVALRSGNAGNYELMLTYMRTRGSFG